MLNRDISQTDETAFQQNIAADNKSRLSNIDSTHVHDETPALLAEHWPARKKVFTVALCTVLVFNTTMSSSLPSAAAAPLATAFNITDHRQKYLPVAVYLIGYIFGPIVFGPMSESLGRRISLLSSFAVYTVFTLACALATSWPSLLVFRYIVAFSASAPPTVLGGVFADLYPGLRSRGVAMMVLALATNVGPLVGPMVSGFAAQDDWRWMFWIALIMAGSLWPVLVFLPETYTPVIIRQVRKKKELPIINEAANAQIELVNQAPDSHKDTRGLKHVFVVVLGRPLYLLFREPIVFFTDLFLVLEYAIFFLFFEAYPIIFEGIYGMSPGIASLAFLPLFFGACIAMVISMWWDSFFAKSQHQQKAWAHNEEYRRLPMACLGGPFLALSQFWIGWTAREDIHWVVPVLSGIPCGIGIELTFMALTNYLTDAYDIFAASALASSVFSRNIAACIILPLATKPMYIRLGVQWSCTILGTACIVIGMVPFVFLKYGAVMRRNSKFCQRISQHQRQGTR